LVVAFSDKADEGVFNVCHFFFLSFARFRGGDGKMIAEHPCKINTHLWPFTSPTLSLHTDKQIHLKGQGYVVRKS
jgi:hypothetical protein